MKNLKLKTKEIGPLGDLLFGKINHLLEHSVSYRQDNMSYDKSTFEKSVIPEILQADAFVAEENFGGKKLGIQVVLLPEWDSENLQDIRTALQKFSAIAIEFELEQDLLSNRDLHLLIAPFASNETNAIIFELYSFPKQ